MTYDLKTGYNWEEVMEKSDNIVECLIKEKFSGQDIAHIGLRLQLIGNHIWNLESFKHIKDGRK